MGWTDANAQVNAIDFLSDRESADKSFENIDTWVGGLTEKHVPKGQLGATFDAIFADQMTRLINGDRFYYLWRLQLGLPEFTQLNSSVTIEQFKDVIERTTGAKHLTGDVFFATDSHLELGEDPTLSKNNNVTPDAAGHRYGDRVAALGIGVYSSGGDDISTNGTVVTIRSSEFCGIDRRYINDVRPDSSDLDPKAVNPDGTPKFGFNSHETIGGTKFADYIDAGNGDDTVYGDDGNDILLGNDGGDHIYGENGDDYIAGGAGGDFLDGGDGNDRIYGGDDDDVVIGGNGNDRLFGEAGAEEIQGNNGNDYIDCGDGDDMLMGGYGDDIILGGAGADKLYGEWGDDTIDGGAGDDIIYGGAGNDILSGGDGDDTYVFNVGFGRDLILETGTSLDTVKFGVGLTLDKFEISRQGTDLVLKVIDTNDILTIKGQFDLFGSEAIEQFQFDNGAITLTRAAMMSYSTNLAVTDPNFSVNPTSLIAGTVGDDDLIAGLTTGFDGINDIVFTGAGNDTIDLSIAGALTGNNHIDGGSNNDTIFVSNFDRAFGSAGDDILNATDATDYRISGGAGNDTLFLGTNGRALGGEGNDKLFVGTGGNNILSGGAGADQFWIANAELPSGLNTIVDFQIGTDVIGIQGAKSLGISATSLKLTQVGADTTINFGSQTLAMLTGIQASSLTPGNASQFVFA